MSSSLCTGNILPLYYLSCDYPFDCCDEPLPVGSCFEENGQICLSGEICVGGTEIISSDLDFGEVCCIGEGYCVEEHGGTVCEIDGDCSSDEECVEGYCESKYQVQTCESKQGVCRPTTCEDKEKVSYTYECDYGDTCCLPDKTSNSKGIWLIIILLILVAFVVAGIVFRDKLKVYWLKIKSKFDKGKKPMHGRPGMYPPGTQPKKQGFLDKIKGFFRGKKQMPIDHSQRNIPQRPLRGPLAIQHAQRQVQQAPISQRQAAPIKPEPVKSTSTPFSQQKPSNKKPVKKSSELDDVLEKLKRIGK
jgi:hypothetical protein